MSKKIYVIIGIALVALGVCIFLYRFADYHKASSEYQKIEESVSSDAINAGEDEDPFTVDVDKLIETNPDFVCWVHIKDVIDYPVVQAKDNQKYLHKTFEGKNQYAGCIFMDMACKNDFTGKNTILYGHNMYNGSMFAKIKKYRSEDFLKENPKIVLFTKDHKKLTYEVFNSRTVKMNEIDYALPETVDEAKEFLATILTNADAVDESIKVTDSDKILTLSTCRGEGKNKNMRVVVHAKLIKEEYM